MPGVGMAFRNDTPTVLRDEMGWGFGAVGSWAATNAPNDLFTYNGSPSRYSLEAVFNEVLSPPPEMQTSGGALGCWSIAYRNAGTGGANVDFMRAADFVSTIFGTLATGASSTNFTPYLVVANAGKFVGVPVDGSIFHYYTLKADSRVNPWLGEIWLDGVFLAAGSHAAGAVSSFVFTSTSWANNGVTRPGIYAQIEFWETWADPSEDVKYATWVPLTEDISEVGVWTPDSGTDDFARVSAPFDAASYTENAAPLAADRVDMGIGGAGGTDDLATALGVSPSKIYGVTGYCFSTGSGAFSAFAVLGDGTNEVNGTAILIDSINTTTTLVSGDATPTGPDWLPTSQPILSYERQ